MHKKGCCASWTPGSQSLKSRCRALSGQSSFFHINHNFFVLFCTFPHKYNHHGLKPPTFYISTPRFDWKKIKAFVLFSVDSLYCLSCMCLQIEALNLILTISKLLAIIKMLRLWNIVNKITRVSMCESKRYNWTQERLGVGRSRRVKTGSERVRVGKRDQKLTQ